MLCNAGPAGRQNGPACMTSVVFYLPTTACNRCKIWGLQSLLSKNHIHHLSNLPSNRLAFHCCLLSQAKHRSRPNKTEQTHATAEPSILFTSVAAMLGALRRSGKEASKTLGRASQLQQQRYLNIHEYQVCHGQRDSTDCGAQPYIQYVRGSD